MAECAFAATIHQWGYQISLTIHLEKTFLIHRRLTSRTDKARKNRIVPFQTFQLAFVKRSSAVPFYAAAAFAYGIIASEMLAYNILRNEDVPYLDYCSEPSVHLEPVFNG